MCLTEYDSRVRLGAFGLAIVIESMYERVVTNKPKRRRLREKINK